MKMMPLRLSLLLPAFVLALLATLSTGMLADADTHSPVQTPADETKIDGNKNKIKNKNVANKKPNVLLILADDVGTGDVPFFWNNPPTSLVDMPNLLEKMANKGVIFKDAHSSPKCAPSRYMVLSGNYPHRGSLQYGTWNVHADSSQFTKYQKSIADILKTEGGYHTGAFGKWHLGGIIPPNGIKTEDKSMSRIITQQGHDWSLPLMQGPGDLGFDTSYITLGGIQSPPYSFFRDDMLTTNPADAYFWEGGEHQAEQFLGTSRIPKNQAGEGDKSWDCSAYDMILVNATNDFIDDHLQTRPQDPFFAYVALGAVHDPHSPANYYMDGTPIFNEYPTTHLDMLGGMDKAVGSLVSMIENKGLANDTIIIFTSDNGGLKGRSADVGHRVSGPLRGAKASIWEGGHRVPLIIRHDGVLPVKKKRRKVVGLNDLYATICELVGIESTSIPSGSAQDSVSFAKYIKWGSAKKGLRKYLGSWHLNGGWHHAIRDGHLKLIHHPRNNTFEMYNLKKDISESVDISKRPWVQGKIPVMYEMLRAIGPCPYKDAVGDFDVSGLGSGVQKNCDWFVQDKARCELYFEGELNCQSVCSRFRAKCEKKKMYSL